MLVSDKHKLVFVHVPKAGGSSVRRAILSVDKKAYEYKEHHGVLSQEDVDHKFKDYFKFGIVRNSYQSCASCYRFMTQHIENTEERVEDKGILNFIKDQVAMSHHYPVQIDYLGEEGKILVDEVFMHEDDLSVVLAPILKQIGFKGSLNFLERGNYFGDYDWKSYYDEESIEYVKKVCRKDIEHFGFTF